MIFPQGGGIGGSFQPLDDDLTAIAALTPTNDDFLQYKSGVWSNRTPAQITQDIAGYRLLNIRTLTSGTSATYTPTAGTRAIFVRVFGASGGGGGVNGQAGTNNLANGGAGGNGGYSEKFLVIGTGETFTYTIGAAGVGGAAGTNNGTAGGTTSFVPSIADTVQVTGGGGGTGVLGSSFDRITQGSPGVGSGGDLNLTASQSISARWISESILWAVIDNNNGSPLFGGGQILTGNTNGTASTAVSAGGLGARAYNTSTNYAGGNGFRGEILIYEYA
jgi:hypothetical protein